MYITMVRVYSAVLERGVVLVQAGVSIEHEGGNTLISTNIAADPVTSGSSHPVCGWMNT